MNPRLVSSSSAARARARAPSARASPRTTASRTSRPATCCGPPAATGTRVRSEAKAIMDAGKLVSDDIMEGVVARAPRQCPTPRRACSSTATPARRRRPSSSTSWRRRRRPRRQPRGARGRRRRPHHPARVCETCGTIYALGDASADVRRVCEVRGRPSSSATTTPRTRSASASPSTPADRAAHRVVRRPWQAGRGRRRRRSRRHRRRAGGRHRRRRPQLTP